MTEGQGGGTKSLLVTEKETFYEINSKLTELYRPQHVLWASDPISFEIHWLERVQNTEKQYLPKLWDWILILESRRSHILFRILMTSPVFLPTIIPTTMMLCHWRHWADSNSSQQTPRTRRFMAYIACIYEILNFIVVRHFVLLFMYVLLGTEIVKWYWSECMLQFHQRQTMSGNRHQ